MGRFVSSLDSPSDETNKSYAYGLLVSSLDIIKKHAPLAYFIQKELSNKNNHEQLS